MGADKKFFLKRTRPISQSQLRGSHTNKRKHTQTSLETLGTKLERLGSKVEASTKEGQTKTRLPDPYRIIRNQPPDHPGANRTVLGHPVLTSRSSYSQQCYTSSPGPYLRIILDNPENSLRNSPKLSIDGSPKPLGVLRQNFWEMKSTSKGRYAPKISDSSSLQLPESQILAKNTMN
jgi:hypothetical protein